MNHYNGNGQGNDMLQKDNIGYLVAILSIIFITMLLLLAGNTAANHTTLLNIIGISAIAASLFIIIVRPHARPAQIKHILTGYLISLAVGLFCYYINQWLIGKHFINPNGFSMHIFLSLTIVVTILLFLMTQTDHPPAVGLCIGLVAGKWTFMSLSIIIIALFLLCVFKRFISLQGKQLM